MSSPFLVALTCAICSRLTQGAKVEERSKYFTMGGGNDLLPGQDTMVFDDGGGACVPMPACASGSGGTDGEPVVSEGPPPDPMGLGTSGRASDSPIIRKLNAKIQALKAKKLEVFSKLRDAMRMAAKVEFYKGSIRAMDEEIQQTRIEKKKRELQIKLVKQNADLSQIEAMASDLMEKFSDLSSTKEAIRDAVETTAKTLHSLGMNAMPPPGQNMKMIGRLIDQVKGGHDEQLEHLQGAQSINSDQLVLALKDAMSQAGPDVNTDQLDSLLSTTPNQLSVGAPEPSGGAKSAG